MTDNQIDESNTCVDNINSTKLYTNVGNYKQYADNILSEYCLPPNKFTYEWGEKKYLDLSTCLMKICNDACVKSGDEELLKSNPFIIVERHHNILCKDGKVKNHFGPHCDNEGPASGPCRSILFYYQIDDEIDNVGLHFYEWMDDDKLVSNDEPIDTFIPTSGDVITFDDNILHCPGDFKTDSESPKIRGVFAIFIKHPSVAKPTQLKSNSTKQCCSIM